MFARTLSLAAMLAATALVVFAGYSYLSAPAPVAKLGPGGPVGAGGVAGAQAASGLMTVIPVLHGHGSNGATAARVVEKDSRFVPSRAMVRVGEKVSFKNLDRVPHRVLIGTTDLGVQQPGQTVTWVATGTGDVRFGFVPLAK